MGEVFVLLDEKRLKVYDKINRKINGMEKKFTVNGMSCANCALGIEKGLSRLNGVKTVSVSLMGKSMTVDFDDAVITYEQIISAVNSLGYKAELFKENAVIEDVTVKMKKRFLTSLFILLPLLYFSMGKMFGFPIPSYVINFSVQAVLSGLIIAVNFSFFTNGIKAIKNHTPNMDTLILLSSGSAYLFSIVVFVFRLTGLVAEISVFFEASAMVLTLVTLGKWIEEKSKKKTGDEIEKLSKILPDYATVIVDGVQKTVKVSEIKVGDTLIFKAGDHVSVDGVIINGNATLDKSVITGESLSVELGVSDKITSGCTVVSGYVLVKATKVGKETLFEKIILTVKRAGESKAPVQKLVDKVSGIFVPIVLAVAIVSLVVWFLLSGDVYSAFNFCISVLVVSCPCALGLATPVAVMVVSGKGANMNVLYKDAMAVQNVYGVNCVLLDKTATLTEGKPKVIKFINYSDESDQKIKEICSTLEQNSSHPLGACVVNFCGQTDKKIENYNYTVGAGVTGSVDGINYFFGNPNVLPECLKERAQKLKESGYTQLFLSDGERIICTFCIADKLKKDAKKVIEKLVSQKIKVAMITGDNYEVAQKISSELGGIEFVSDVLPEDKYDIVQKYKSEGYKVAFVGDGVNDSPALKGADVGIAVGSGSEIAIDSADIVLLGSKISLLIDALGLGKYAYRVIKGNLFWAFFYNVLAIPVASGIFSFLGVILTPAISSVCMCLSSLFVVTNALRIKNYKSSIKGENNMKVYIDGMMCKHCEKKVLETLSAIENIESVSINLKKKYAEIVGNPDKEILTKKIAEAGYQVTKFND